MKNSPETLAKRNRLKKEWYDKLKDTDFPKYINRKCKGCGEIKLCKWNSSFSQTGVPEYKSRCNDCFNAWQQTYRSTAKGRKSINKCIRKRNAKRKQWAVTLLGGECKICGYKKSLSALTFHHRYPKEKDFDIGPALGNKPVIIIKKELQKCNLLCFNCHMEEEEIRREENVCV